jgi:hypothetical protein
MNTTTLTPNGHSINSTATGQLVDRFGRLKADASDISEQLDAIKTLLIEREGESKLEGELFRLSLSNSIRQTTDWKAVALLMAKKAGVSDKVFDNAVAANTNLTDMWVARSNSRVTK